MTSVQITVAISTIVILVLTLLLTFFITRDYAVKRTRALLFWSLGLWLFVAGVGLETAFALGVYNGWLANLYIVVVTLLVQFLALGSMQLISSTKLKKAYYGFCIATTAILFYSVIAFPAAYILSSAGVAIKSTSLAATIASLLTTFPAAAILVAVAALTYIKTRSPKMLSIIAGVIVVSVAGTLYIVSFPALLYYSEFFGILLLWLGFFDMRMLRLKGK